MGRTGWAWVWAWGPLVIALLLALTPVGVLALMTLGTVALSVVGVVAIVARTAAHPAARRRLLRSAGVAAAVVCVVASFAYLAAWNLAFDYADRYEETPRAIDLLDDVSYASSLWSLVAIAVLWALASLLPRPSDLTPALRGASGAQGDLRRQDP